LGDPYSAALLTGVAVLLAASFFCSCSEAALVAVSRVRLTRLAEEGDRRAIAALALTASPTFISALIVSNNLINITISCLVTLLVLHANHDTAGDHAVRMIGLAVVLLFGEITPKNVGAAYPAKISCWVVGPVRALTWLLSPIVTAATAAGGALLRGAGVRESHGGHFITKDDLRAAVDMGEEEEVLEPDEGEMFDTALAMAETSVRRIMVPRVDVVALDASATLDEALASVQDSGFSRIPVYEGHIDRVVGVLYATELLRALRSGDGEGKTAQDLMREAILIAETTPVDEVLGQMRERQVHFAVIIGDQGGTEGIVTIEDILEELVGEIEDEHDVPGEEIQRLSANEALVDPKARIEEVNEALGVTVPGDQHETIAGYVAGQIGRIPDAGETIRLDDLEITVQGDREAPRLRVRRLTDPSDCEGGDG